MSNDEILQY